MGERHTEFVRVIKDKNYSMINNVFLHRPDLSWKAKGILAYILSLPDDWKIYLEEVERHSTDGVTSFRSGWKELKEAGYVDRFPIREGGKIVSWQTVIRESVDIEGLSPHAGFLNVENEHVDNTKLLITNNTNNLINKKDMIDSKESIDSVKKSFKAETEENFNKLWNLYPKKQGKAVAYKAYLKALKDGVTNKQIQDGIVKYNKKIKAENIDPQYIAMGSTYFNQRRWEDEIPENGGSIGGVVKDTRSQDFIDL